MSVAALTLLYQQVKAADDEAVKNFCAQIGLPETITSILQPLKSAEINSQNFIISFDSGKKVLLRRCHRLQGEQNYQALNKLAKYLAKEGVNVPQLSPVVNDELPYYEKEGTVEKVCWVFFKYIEADHYFTGINGELKEAAYQIGKMHTSLQKKYRKQDIFPFKNTIPNHYLKPFFTAKDWEKYSLIIKEKLENGGDEYDRAFYDNQDLILRMLTSVEENFPVLDSDIQNIHFDLNSSNFLICERQVFIMDFDEIQLGNVYTDLGFALHRLLTTSLDHKHLDSAHLKEAAKEFILAYCRGNPDLKFDAKKLIVAMYNRALRNVKTNLELKYEKNSHDWLTSIPVNLERLREVENLSILIEDLEI
ncbi:hypothetical protein PHSC3_000355 [Chlamydiales bacterium STE3]|nr:hypothetical protein PHSC3_000355 [Chlamydiales bacterium STE3]